MYNKLHFHMAMKFLLLLFIYHFSTTKAQLLQSNITQGSTLYTNSTTNFWPSLSGHFAFGFYPSGNGFRVGIWLVGSPQNIIVWTAWQSDPEVSAGATLRFSRDGWLHLYNSIGEVQLVAETTQRASVASMHDTGNFVLYNSNSELVWDTFDYPTNTLLVRQKLVQNKFLYSSISETDHSTGNFKLWMQGDGNLRAYPLKGSMDDGYWSTRTSGVGKNVSLNLAPDSRLYLQNSTGFIVKNLTEGEPLVDKTLLYRATFDVDGILRLYQHQIGTTGSLNSKILWEAINEQDRCVVKGICGLNSYCTSDGANISCLCPPGFDFVDPKETDKGCKLNVTAGADCFDEIDSTNCIMSPLPNTGWEINEYDTLSPTSEEACSDACLKDCNCVVATFGDQTCYKQRLPLRYGQSKSSTLTKTLTKIRSGSLPGDPLTERNLQKVGRNFLVVGLVLMAFSLIIFMSIGYLIYSYQMWNYKIMMITRQAGPQDVIEEINLRSFSYDQIVAATDNFQEEIGRGSSGKVYRGTMTDAGGNKDIAVKRLKNMVEDGEREFRNEMKIIGRTHHKNLVHLIGFCSEGSKRILVYEFMKNGSLCNLIFNPERRPSWKERLRIALEIAKGIHYLHEECVTQIIHCDIKPHNILMDDSWSAKISDFGLSKLLKLDQTRTYTVPRGTPGYEAPEWHKNNAPITVKADVYSFGVVLLEIVSCRKNLVLSAPDDEIVLMDWICRCYHSGEIERVVVGEERDQVDMEELETTVKIGLLCVQTQVISRPSIKEVILMMEGNVVTAPPPPPPPSSSSSTLFC